MPTLKGELERQYNAGPDGAVATRRFVVRSDSQADDGPQILTAPFLPAYGDTHPRNPLIFALDFEAEQDSKSWQKWIATIGYRVPERGESPDDDNPLLIDPEISISQDFQPIAAVAEVDTTTGVPTAPLANTAGEAYDPAPEAELPITNIQISRNEAAAFSVSTYLDLNNSINNAAFGFGDYTFAALTVQVRAQIGTLQRYVSPVTGALTLYRRVSYVLRHNPLGWDISALDQGSYYLNADDDKIPFLTAIDRTADPPITTSEPYIGLLDGAGGKLPDGGTAVFNSHPAKKRRNFGVLNLPAGP